MVKWEDVVIKWEDAVVNGKMYWLMGRCSG